MSIPLYASNVEISSLLMRLDSLIAQKDVFIIAKENKIAQLQKQKKEVRTLEERYWLNKTLFIDINLIFPSAKSNISLYEQ